MPVLSPGALISDLYTPDTVLNRMLMMRNMKCLRSGTADHYYAGENDIGFCSSSEDPELEYIPLRKNEQVLIVYPGHPFANQKEIAASDLIGESLILRAKSDRMTHLKSALLKVGFDLDQYPPKLILGTTIGMISAVASKAGIAIVPRMAIKNSEAMGLIKVVKIKNLRIKRDFACIYRKDWVMDSTSKNFIQFLENRFKQN